MPVNDGHSYGLPGCVGMNWTNSDKKLRAEMNYHIVLSFIPHDNHGFWLWAIMDPDMETILAVQQLGTTTFKTPEEALAAAKEHS